MSTEHVPKRKGKPPRCGRGPRAVGGKSVYFLLSRKRGGLKEENPFALLSSNLRSWIHPYAHRLKFVCSEQTERGIQDCYRLPLLADETFIDVELVMRQRRFPADFGPFFGTGYVNPVSVGSGPEKIRKRPASGVRWDARIEKICLWEELLSSLFDTLGADGTVKRDFRAMRIVNSVPNLFRWINADGEEVYRDVPPVPECWDVLREDGMPSQGAYSALCKRFPDFHRLYTNVCMGMILAQTAEVIDGEECSRWDDRLAFLHEWAKDRLVDADERKALEEFLAAERKELPGKPTFKPCEQFPDPLATRKIVRNYARDAVPIMPNPRPAPGPAIQPS